MEFVQSADNMQMANKTVSQKFAKASEGIRDKRSYSTNPETNQQ
jgi:hypothetical protein